ncbi:sm LSM2 [Olea europaea subsp. europaea]|uniref:Sm LSM2 n=1 Tax=Olea europaea subsp. europaea TaxID=158383 RepID=A0A8S0QMW5_OLEEU|nr:sm LSM2 [Olea europaea subsp. europaea]
MDDLFFSNIKDLVGREVTKELKNDLDLRRTLHLVDQYPNIKLENTRVVVNQDNYPHMPVQYTDKDKYIQKRGFWFTVHSCHVPFSTLSEIPDEFVRRRNSSANESINNYNEELAILVREKAAEKEIPKNLSQLRHIPVIMS